MFDDGVEMFHPLNLEGDSILLKDNPTELSNWFKRNCVSLNLKKCKKLTLCRSIPLSVNNYGN